MLFWDIRRLLFNHKFSLMLSQTSYLWLSLLCIFYETTQMWETSKVLFHPIILFSKNCSFFGIFYWSRHRVNTYCLYFLWFQLSRGGQIHKGIIFLKISCKLQQKNCSKKNCSTMFLRKNIEARHSQLPKISLSSHKLFINCYQ